MQRNLSPGRRAACNSPSEPSEPFGTPGCFRRKLELLLMWSNIDHDGAAALKLSEGSPLPPALSAKDLPGV